MRVMFKDVELPTGAVAGCWVADLCEVRPVEGYARLRLRGYKDAAAFSSGKPFMGTVERDITVADVASYDAAWTDMSVLLMSSGEFAGGQVGLADQPEPQV